MVIAESTYCKAGDYGEKKLIIDEPSKDVTRGYKLIGASLTPGSGIADKGKDYQGFSDRDSAPPRPPVER